jgi:hypothetical protein
MARLRTIKPGFFTNDLLAELPPLGRLLFAGLWCQADRAGRLEDRPRRLKAEVLPYDDCDVDQLLNALADRGFIRRYAVEGNRYITIPTFSAHQNPHVKEAASTIPAPLPSDACTTNRKEQHRESTVQASGQHSSFRAVVGSGDLSLGSGDLSLGSGPTTSASQTTLGLAPDADAPDAEPGPKPSEAPLAVIEPVPKPRSRDPIWDALAAIYGEPMLDGERSARNGICKQFRDAARKQGMAGQQMAALIGTAHDNWANVMGGVTETPNGLAKYFTTLLGGPQINGRSNGTVTAHTQHLRELATVNRGPKRGSAALDDEWRLSDHAQPGGE